MKVKKICAYCGCTYGEIDMEGAEAYGLASHGVCPGCMDRAMRDMGVLL